MATDLTSVLIFTASYAAVLIAALFLMNWLTKGFMWTYIRARARPMNKMIVEVRSQLGKYYALGRPVGDKSFTYKAKSGEDKTINYPKNSIYTLMGVNSIEVEDETNSVVNRDMKGVEGFDAIETDALVKRAYLLGGLSDRKLIMICLFGFAIIIIGLLILGYQIFTMKDFLLALEESIKNINKL